MLQKLAGYWQLAFVVICVCVSFVIVQPEIIIRIKSPTAISYVKNKNETRSLTFWTSDLHDMVRTDLASTVASLGHTVILAGHKGRGLPYPEILRNPSIKFPACELSPLIQNMHHLTNDYWTEQQVKELFNFYKDDPEMSKVDAFICGFPAAYCEAFMPFNKPIIIVASHRYSLGRCTQKHWDTLNEHLQWLEHTRADRGHFIGGITEYDVEYINYFTGIKPTLLPLSALWYVDATQHPYTKARQEILVGPLQRTSFSQMDQLQAAGKGTYTFAFAKKLYGRYNLSQIAQHRAMVVLPYAVTSGGLIEVYALGVPLFVPDPDFLYKLGTMNDRRMRDIFYCGPDTYVPPRHNSSMHTFSPEDNDIISFKYWMRFTEFYRWPHVTQFSSWNDLIYKLNSTNFDDIHRAMLKENESRKLYITRTWHNIAQTIRHAGDKPLLPDSYERAVHQIWGRPWLMSD